MNIFILLVLCLVQGLTEFLPVSSSGHLLLFSQLFGINDNNLFLNLFLHLATLLAVVIVYRKTIFKLLKKPFQPMTYKLALSTLITVIFAIAYETTSINNIIINVYGFCFLLTGILLIFTHYYQKKSIILKADNEIKTKSAIIVGIIQGFAVLPGISRSGSTICSLIISGNSQEKSAEFSFLLSIPIIIGGFIIELLKINSTSIVFESIKLYQYFIAFVLTFIVSIISLKLTLKLMKNKKLNIFGIYLILISIFTILINIF